MNPFQFGSVVRGEYFFDRKEECARIVDTLSGGNNLVLFAPRRYGKTSLVFRAMEKLNARKIRCVYFDFFPIYDVEDFCRVFANRVFEQKKGWQKILGKIAEWLRGAHPKLSLDPEGKAFLELDFSGTAPTSAALESVLRLPERIASERERLVVVFDEFQEVSRFENIRLEALLRSVVQQRENVSYLFLGSKTHLLSAMFTERSRPFFNSAATMKISKLPQTETIDFLKKRFSASGIALSDALARSIIELADGVPYYVQLLAAEVWQDAKNRETAKLAEADITRSAEQIIRLKRDYYAELYDRLSPVQKKLSRALAIERVGIFSAAYAKRFSLPGASSLQKAAAALTDLGVIEKTDDGISFSDPFFRRFLLELP